jgi:sugar lactone lactonase YvrE
LVRVSADGSKVDVIASTAGRPLGVALDRTGNLYTADAKQGLLRIEDGRAESLLRVHAGLFFRVTDDLDIADDGTIYFTDASWKYELEDFDLDILEHRGNGRLMAYHPDIKKSELLLGDLRFANGVALAPDQQSVLVAETGNYRVLRYWLAGAKKGTSEVFADNLPGFPDNITYSKERNRYWLALAAPRDKLVDKLAPYPRLRRAIARLPRWLRPGPKRHAQIVALDLDGNIVDYLDDDSRKSFAPISSVRELNGALYLGSFLRDAVGKIYLGR